MPPYLQEHEHLFPFHLNNSQKSERWQDCLPHLHRRRAHGLQVAMALPSHQVHRLDRVRTHHMCHVVGRLQIIQIQVGEPVVVLLHRHGANAVPRGHGLPLHHVTEAILHHAGSVVDVRVVRLEAVGHGILRRALPVLVRRRRFRLLHLHLLPVVLLVVQPAQHPLVQLQEQRKET